LVNWKDDQPVGNRQSRKVGKRPSLTFIKGEKGEGETGK